MIEFFTPEEGALIVKTIRDAEKLTSSEIRVHLDSFCPEDVFERAVKVFHYLEMDKTNHRNAVLFYIVPKDKKFCIYGDIGIHEKVNEGYWADVAQLISTHFEKSLFTMGICEAIRLIGIKLKAHFPINKNDVNELSDEISYS